jgi:hypothetical protein
VVHLAALKEVMAVTLVEQVLHGEQVLEVVVLVALVEIFHYLEFSKVP